MRTIETNVYKFDELSEQAKQKAVEKLCDINVMNEFWYEHIISTAKDMGIKITDWDIERQRYVRAELTDDMANIFDKIFENFGKQSELYKTAERYKEIYYKAHIDKDIEREFLVEICGDYSEILREEYEYQTSEGCIIETIKANEYEFTEDGKLI